MPLDSGMKTDAVRKLLKKACTDAGSARQWAISHAIAPGYVTDVLAGRCEPGDKILGALGLQRIVDYRAAE